MELDISKKREFSEFQKRARVKRCVHPNQEECSKEIIRAHSIQNNKIFSKIAEEGNVMNIVHDNSLFNEDLEAVGKGKANTFLGFCQKHDTSLFSEIENNKNYIPGNQEQEFLFAYRALAKELIAKEYAKNLYTLLIKEKASFGLLKILEGTELGLNDLKELKPDLDRALLKKEFEIIETEVIVEDKSITN